MQILTLDMLSLNTDRHFNNLGLIVDASTGVYKAAPIFDNGNSLLSDWDRFDEETVEENLEKVYGQPFSASLEMQAREAGIGLMVDYEKLQYILEKEPVSRGFNVSTETLATLYKSIQEKGLPNLTNNAALENKAAFYYAATSGQRGQRQYASYVPRRETAGGLG